MVRESVESSSITSVGYSAASSTLEVEFSSGGVYRYLSVPPGEHRALMCAESKGRHVNANIKGRFEFQRVSP